MSGRDYHRILSHRTEPGGPGVRFKALRMILAGATKSDPSPDWNQGFESGAVGHPRKACVAFPGGIVDPLGGADRLATGQIETEQTEFEVIVVE